jgi:hypothetical protein
MVIFNDSYIWLLVLVLELFLALVRFFLLLLLLILVVASFLVFLLLFFELGLLLQLINSFPLPDFVVPNDALSHLIVIGVDELTQDLLLLFIFPFEFLIEDLDLADFGAELQVVGLESSLFGA